jgi:hypothetical protein
MQKKASLSLSIEAIVILVIAISLLGLGLGFTKDMFGQLKSQLVIPPPDIPATADEPIILPSRGQLDIKPSKDTVFTVNFFNDKQTAVFLPMIKCKGIYLSNYVYSSQKVDAQTYKSFQLIIRAGTFSIESGLSHNTLCEISFCDCGDMSCCASPEHIQASKQISVNADFVVEPNPAPATSPPPVLTFRWFIKIFGYNG